MTPTAIIGSIKSDFCKQRWQSWTFADSWALTWKVYNSLHDGAEPGTWISFVSNLRGIELEVPSLFWNRSTKLGLPSFLWSHDEKPLKRSYVLKAVARCTCCFTLLTARDTSGTKTNGGDDLLMQLWSHTFSTPSTYRNNLCRLAVITVLDSLSVTNFSSVREWVVSPLLHELWQHRVCVCRSTSSTSTIHLCLSICPAVSTREALNQNLLSVMDNILHTDLLTWQVSYAFKYAKKFAFILHWFSWKRANLFPEICRWSMDIICREEITSKKCKREKRFREWIFEFFSSTFDSVSSSFRKLLNRQLQKNRPLTATRRPTQIDIISRQNHRRDKFGDITLMKISYSGRVEGALDNCEVDTGFAPPSPLTSLETAIRAIFLCCISRKCIKSDN